MADRWIWTWDLRVANPTLNPIGHSSSKIRFYIYIAICCIWEHLVYIYLFYLIFPVHLFFLYSIKEAYWGSDVGWKTIGLLFYNNKVYCLNLSIFEAGLNLPDAYKKKEGVWEEVRWQWFFNLGFKTINPVCLFGVKKDCSQILKAQEHLKLIFPRWIIFLRTHIMGWW